MSPSNSLVDFLRKNCDSKFIEKVENIIQSPTFLRLKGISQLGTMHYCFPLTSPFSRYEHSLLTAESLARVLYANSLPENYCERVIYQALLHDIGHVFFSHIGERYLKQQIGFNHEQYGKKMIHTNYPEIYSCLFDRDGNKLNWELVDANIDFDTLEGIIKAGEILGISNDFLPEMEKIFYYSANDKSWWIKQGGLPLINRFWELKSKIYQKYVYSHENQWIEYTFLEIFNLLCIKSEDWTEEMIIEKIQTNQKAKRLYSQIKTKKIPRCVQIESGNDKLEENIKNVNLIQTKHKIFVIPLQIEINSDIPLTRLNEELKRYISVKNVLYQILPD